MKIRDRIKELRRVKASELLPSSFIGSGVYAVVNIVNWKCYVGSAINISSRLNTHRKTLRGNRHVNLHLMGSWKEHGESAFLFVLLETAPPEIVVQREQFWIDLLNSSDPAHGYNLRKLAGSNFGLRFTVEQRAKVSAARKGNTNSLGTKQSQETIEKRRLKLIGQKRNWSDESRRKVGDIMRHKALGCEHNAKTYYGLVDPDGISIGPVKNLTKFCRDRGLKRGNLLMVLNGQRRSHAGWTAITK